MGANCACDLGGDRLWKMVEWFLAGLFGEKSHWVLLSRMWLDTGSGGPK